MTRAVDDAMAAERPEKQTVRELWMDEVQRHEGEQLPDDVPLYLTLPGARGGDIEALIDRGVLRLTETGAIEDPEAMKVVAIEHSPSAVIALQRRYPGLKIVEKSVSDMLHSIGPLQWPTGSHKTYCRAQVVNLDFDTPLKGVVEHGQLVFPSLALVQKLATLHATPAPIDWTLGLTLHGETVWDSDTDALACRFLAANFARDAAFSGGAREVLGSELHQGVCDSPDSVGLNGLDRASQQRVLMVLVPKQIAFDAHTIGWNVDTVENLCYGGTENRAPMVTWLLRFRWDSRASTDPEALYREALGRSLRRRGEIAADGAISRISDAA